MTDEQLTKALRAAAQAFLEALDEPVQPDRSQSQAVAAEAGRVRGSKVDYDPLYDTPPWEPAVKSDDRAAMDMCTITYLGGIARINAERGRGATTAEVRELALKAGYSGANAVNGWNSNPRSGGQIENIDNHRILNATGHKFLLACADSANITIVGDITPLPIPDSGKEG